MPRTSQEIAVRAIAFGTLGFRASLEVTEHPQAKALCFQMLPWLEQLDSGIEIEEFHREILQTPHQTLPRASLTEAYWRGEGASLLGWAIQLVNKPNPLAPVDPGVLVSNLRLLQPNVRELIQAASLRSQREIEDYCAFCISVRHELQGEVVEADGRATLKNLQQKRLKELGLSEACDRLERREVDSLLASKASNIKGLYVVRAMTAEWLLGADS